MSYRVIDGVEVKSDVRLYFSTVLYDQTQNFKKYIFDWTIEKVNQWIQDHRELWENAEMIHFKCIQWKEALVGINWPRNGRLKKVMYLLCKFYSTRPFDDIPTQAILRIYDCKLSITTDTFATIYYDSSEIHKS